MKTKLILGMAALLISMSANAGVHSTIDPVVLSESDTEYLLMDLHVAIEDSLIERKQMAEAEVMLMPVMRPRNWDFIENHDAENDMVQFKAF